MSAIRGPAEPKYSVAEAAGDGVKFGAAWGIATGLGVAALTAGRAPVRAAAGARAGLSLAAGFAAASTLEAVGLRGLVGLGMGHQDAHGITSAVLLGAAGAGALGVAWKRLPTAAIPALAGVALIGACVAVSAVTGGDDPLHDTSGFHDIGS